MVRRLPPRLRENRNFIASLMTKPSRRTIAKATTKEIRCLQELLHNIKLGNFGKGPVKALSRARRQAVGKCLNTICHPSVPPAQVKAVLLSDQKGGGGGGGGKNLGKLLENVLNTVTQLAPIILPLIL